MKILSGAGFVMRFYIHADPQVWNTTTVSCDPQIWDRTYTNCKYLTNRINLLSVIELNTCLIAILDYVTLIKWQPLVLRLIRWTTVFSRCSTIPTDLLLDSRKSIQSSQYVVYKGHFMKLVFKNVWKYLSFCPPLQILNVVFTWIAAEISDLFGQTF